jgi:hypothetical protein
MIIDKVKLIRERMKEAYDRHKSYVDNWRRPLEFKERDQVFLKVAPGRTRSIPGRKESYCLGIVDILNLSRELDL